MTRKKPNYDLEGRGIERLWKWLDLNADYCLAYGPDDEYDSCPVCGCEMSEWEECWQIGCDDGWISDLYESDPLWYDEDDVEMCDVCQGKGGWWVCPNLHHPEAGTLQASAEGGEG